ncbi:MAG: putative lipoprotein [Pseudarthrobacter sp.]|nr:putative lipoprotein [Pseudarthrobacter sp.]
MRFPHTAAALALATVLALAGCGTYPADPAGSLERVADGTLRVGASENGEWVDFAGEDVHGTEADLVRGFAARLGAEVEWVPGTEHILAEGLKHGELDLVIGGLDDKTPWAQHGGLTRAYAESRDSRGSIHKHVMLVPLGENAFLMELDRFLMEAKERG